MIDALIVLIFATIITLGVVVVSAPFWIYYVVKLATFAYFKTRSRFNPREEKDGSIPLQKPTNQEPRT